MNSDFLAELIKARRKGVLLEGKIHNDLTLTEAYKLQDAYCEAIYPDQRLLGYKMGLTSKPKQVTMGISKPIFGRLYEADMYQSGAVPHSAFVQPRCEPEVALLVREDIDPSDSKDEVIAKLYGATVAVEILDSRFKGYRFNVEEVVADNTSAAGYCIYPGFVPVPPEIDRLAVEISLNGEGIHFASTSAVMGSPVDSLMELIGLLAAFNERLRKGDVVMTGGITDAVPVGLGDVVTVKVEQLSSIELCFKGE